MDEVFRVVIVESGLVLRTKELIAIADKNDVIMRLEASINIDFNDKPTIWIEPVISKFASELNVNIDVDNYYTNS